MGRDIGTRAQRQRSGATWAWIAAAAAAVVVLFVTFGFNRENNRTARLNPVDNPGAAVATSPAGPAPKPASLNPTENTGSR